MGVAAMRFNTRLCLKLNKRKEEPKTPAINKEKPSWPGRIKSICLYTRPCNSLLWIDAMDGLVGKIFSSIEAMAFFNSVCNTVFWPAEEALEVMFISYFGTGETGIVFLISSIAVSLPFCNNRVASFIFKFASTVMLLMFDIAL